MTTPIGKHLTPWNLDHLPTNDDPDLDDRAGAAAPPHRPTPQ